MSEYIINITEEETIQCHVCNEVFNTNEITTDDYYFAWREPFVLDFYFNNNSIKLINA